MIGSWVLKKGGHARVAPPRDIASLNPRLSGFIWIVGNHGRNGLEFDEMRGQEDLRNGSVSIGSRHAKLANRRFMQFRDDLRADEEFYPSAHRRFKALVWGSAPTDR